MTENQHPLSEAAAAVLATKFAPGVAFQMLTSVSPDDLTAYGRLAFDAGREYERATARPIADEQEEPTPRRRGAVVTVYDRNPGVIQPAHVPGSVHVNGQPVLLVPGGLAVRTDENGAPVVTLSLIPSELHFTQEGRA